MFNRFQVVHPLLGHPLQVLWGLCQGLRALRWPHLTLWPLKCLLVALCPAQQLPRLMLLPRRRVL